MTKNNSRTQIIATIGPASSDVDTLTKMIKNQLDFARLNFSWGTLEEHAELVAHIREAADQVGREIPIIQDVPGPRLQGGEGHSLDTDSSVLTQADKEFIDFGRKHNVDYVALSFVRNKADIKRARELTGDTPIIAKIERKEALANYGSILQEADAVMVARGDLGDQIPFEYLPFVQTQLIQEANKQDVPVVTATEMLLSMTENEKPTRAEVTDVAYAIMHGSDAVMLSEETATGTYPIEVLGIMEKIVRAAEQFQAGGLELHRL